MDEYLKELGVSEDILNLPKYTKEAYVYYRAIHDANPGFEKEWWNKHYNEIKDFEKANEAINRIGLSNYKKQFLLAQSQWIADSTYLIVTRILCGEYDAINDIPIDINVNEL